MTHVAGPYWVRTKSGGAHDVCGRNAAIVRTYPSHQIGLATADCRALQRGFVKGDKALRDAAPDLLEALVLCGDLLADMFRVGIAHTPADGEECPYGSYFVGPGVMPKIVAAIAKARCVSSEGGAK